MALDVHLTRDVNERWGFELVGGADDDMPLTIVKIQDSSPASRAGLQSGDTIITINGEEAIDFRHEEACRRVAECADDLTVGVVRGLYDPVLDDQEPIYFEPGDLDPESQPTEVPFKVQQFVEPGDLGSRLIDYDDTNDPLDIPFDPSVILNGSRSLTASPYMNPVKPYRPFSTEPVPEVPSLEDPIILNPDYKDEFGKGPNDVNPDYILNAHNKDGSCEGRYKLPISPQYDPDGKREVKNNEIDSVLLKYLNMEKLSNTSVSIDKNITKTSVHDCKVSKTKEAILTNHAKSIETISKSVKEESLKFMEQNINSKEEKYEEDVRISDKRETISKDRAETLISEELKYIDKMKQEIDVAQIEKTAISIVEESIERASSVAEEIKKEIEEELASDVEHTSTENVKYETKPKTNALKSKSKVKQSTELFDINETDFEVIDKIASNKEHLQYIEDNIREQQKKAEDHNMSQSVFRKDTMESSESHLTSYGHETSPLSITKDVKHSEKTSAKTEEYKKVTKTVSNGTKSDKSGAQQRTYELGLQTIPNIRGIAYSSYHYDLLLRTFFLHLTDVMVALSRFLLTQPIFNTENSETRKIVPESKMYESGVKDVTKTLDETVKIEKQKVDDEKMKEMKTQEKKLDRRQLVTPISMGETKIESRDSEKQEMKSDSKITAKIERSEAKLEQKKEEIVLLDQVAEKKAISGAQLAQRTEKKLTKDVTQKMDAVISEFQTIAVEENKQEMLQRSRRSRSRSRSQIEEEVAKESDPLDWLAKVDSHRTSQEICEERLSKKEYSSTETSEKKRYEKLEKQEIKYKKTKTPKQMYVAVVESHVYTNKDVIFEDAAEFSETSSVQSADEVNTAFEAMEAMQTENVMLENAVHQIEQAKIVDESQALSRINASAATVKKIEGVVQESKTIKQEELRKEHVSIVANDSYSKAASSEMHNVCSELNINDTKKESMSITQQEYKETARAVTESSQKVKITDTIDVVKAEIKAKVEPPVQIEDVTEKVLLKTEKPNYKEEDEYAALKIVKEVEIENDSKDDIIEIEEVEVKKIEMNKELQLDTSEIITEKSIICSNETVSMESQSKTTSEINISSTSIENHQSESHISEHIDQESSFTAKSANKHLTIRTDLNIQKSIDSPPSTIDTPTPSTVPPTPLTDEYVFKLTIPLPKSRSSTPIPRDCTLSPEEEDPHIVKKKLIPHIETTIEKIVYDPPLPTPPGDKPLSPIFKTPGLFGGSSKPIYKIRFPPIYRKPGLFGGADNPEYNKEEIREIERKSSLLASAIDETIKSIEEYKEEVGIEKKKEVKVVHFKEETTQSYQESYSKETQQNGYEESKTSIEKTIENNDVVTMNGDTESIVEIAESKAQILEPKNWKPTSETELTQEVNVEIQQEFEPEDTLEMTSTAVRTASNCMLITAGMGRDTEIPIEMKNISESNAEDEKQITKVKVVEEEEKKDPMLGYRPVVFDPEAIQRGTQHYVAQEPSTQAPRGSPYMTESGEIMGTMQGIVDGLEEPVMDPELAKELGKPGISEQKIAELISGEAEMLREAHVMGLSRVLNSHMHRADDSSVDFQKIKPMIDSLKDSEVLKALNEDLARQREEERKKEEKRWTTFLQKPQRAPPKAKFGYHGWTAAEQALVEEPYKVKIVKQAKPKVAPDYKPEDFETGPLPWEQRAELEAAIPPAEPEEPILVPELPEYLEAVDPLKESEVPDLEDTGIPLPPPKEPTPPPVIEQIPEEEEPLIEQEPEAEAEEVVEEDKKETREEMENRLGEQLVRSVQAMVDPNAPVEQQLSQMRAQLAALAQLPEVIQQTLELVSRQLNKMGQQETHIEVSSKTESHSQEIEVTENHVSETQIQNSERSENTQNHEDINGGADLVTIQEVQDSLEAEEQLGETVMQQCMTMPTPQVTEEDIREEKMLKEKHQQRKVEADSRQIKQRAAPRVGKPTRMFGPPDPDSRPVVLPGGRRWRKTEDVYNEQMIAETLQAQSELIQGKAMGFESDLLPFDTRINFMKYEKPPVNLDHLQRSETYKLVHHMDQPPLKKVEMLTPVIAEADYRERCRSSTPSVPLM